MAIRQGLARFFFLCEAGALGKPPIPETNIFDRDPFLLYPEEYEQSSQEKTEVLS
jgi:hypothetical protein